MVSPALFKSDKHDWQTPPEVFGPLHEEFGFTLDAAASAENALLPRFWSLAENALLQDWSGERIWCNPPYGRGQIAFIRKAAERKAEIAVLLIPARPDTAAWHDYILPTAEIRFLRGRIRFVGAPYPAPFPSALAIWRKDC